MDCNTYSDSWCINAGKTGIVADYASFTVNLLKAYKTTNYTISTGIYIPGGSEDNQWNSAYFIRNNSKAVKSFIIYSRGAADGGRYFDWITQGLI